MLEEGRGQSVQLKLLERNRHRYQAVIFKMTKNALSAQTEKL